MKYDVGNEFAFFLKKCGLDKANTSERIAFDWFPEQYESFYTGFLVFCRYILSSIGKHNSFKPGSFFEVGKDNNRTTAINCSSSDINIEFGLNSQNLPELYAKNVTTGTILCSSLNSTGTCDVYGSSHTVNGCYLFQSSKDYLEINYYDKEAVDAVEPLLNGDDMTIDGFSEYGISPDEHVFCYISSFSFGKFLGDSDYFDKLMPSLLENEKNQGKSR